MSAHEDWFVFCTGNRRVTSYRRGDLFLRGSLPPKLTRSSRALLPRSRQYPGVEKWVVYVHELIAQPAFSARWIVTYQVQVHGGDISLYISPWAFLADQSSVWRRSAWVMMHGRNVTHVGRIFNSPWGAMQDGTY